MRCCAMLLCCAVTASLFTQHSTAQHSTAQHSMEEKHLVRLPTTGLAHDQPLPEDTHRDLSDLCTQLLQWPEVVDIKVISGGITNALFKVTSLDQQLALVRVFGQKTELIIDRQREEKVVAALQERGFGKKIYARFSGGQIEEWLEGASIDPPDMVEPTTRALIATKLGQMHALEVDIDISREPSLFVTLDSWMKTAMTVEFDDEAKQKTLESIRLQEIAEELQALRPILEAFESPVVLCHNDLLSGNIVKDGDAVTFLDFEYGAFNYRAFDIGNHFCECCGFECDWSQFPQKSDQLIFFGHYLSGYLDIPLEQVTDDQVKQLYNEVRPWPLAAHLFWGIWGIVQAKNSPIDFDFLSYARDRLAGFRQQKGDLLSYGY